MKDPKHDSKIVRMDSSQENARREAEEAAEMLVQAFLKSSVPLPEAELRMLTTVAMGDTGQCRIVRYLLFLLPGESEPTGYQGQGLLELRALDQKLADAFLKVLAWWRGPTHDDAPLYAALEALQNRFRT